MSVLCFMCEQWKHVGESSLGMSILYFMCKQWKQLSVKVVWCQCCISSVRRKKNTPASFVILFAALMEHSHQLPPAIYYLHWMTDGTQWPAASSYLLFTLNDWWHTMTSCLYLFTLMAHNDQLPLSIYTDGTQWPAASVYLHWWHTMINYLLLSTIYTDGTQWPAASVYLRWWHTMTSCLCLFTLMAHDDQLPLAVYYLHWWHTMTNYL